MGTKRRTLGKDLRRTAEVAAEHFLRDRIGCVMVRRAVRTQWQKVDFWGADLVGKLSTGGHVYAQVTTGGASCMSRRRDKLESTPWHDSDTVLLLNLVTTQSPAKGRKREYWFRVEEMEQRSESEDRGREFLWRDWDEPVEVPREWFRA